MEKPTRTAPEVLDAALSRAVADFFTARETPCPLMEWGTHGWFMYVFASGEFFCSNSDSPRGLSQDIERFGPLVGIVKFDEGNVRSREALAEALRASAA